jgi:hypothetical protein
MARGKKHTPEKIVSLFRQVEAVAKLSLDKLVLKDIASGDLYVNFPPPSRMS